MPLPNSAYAQWFEQDQVILSALLLSLSPDVLSQCLFLKTSKEAWDKLDGLYAAQYRASAMQMRMQLATLKKHDLTANDYFNRDKTLADNLAAAGALLCDDEVIAYLLTGLPEEFDSLVTSVTTQAKPMSLGEVYTNLLSFDMRLISRQGILTPGTSPAGHYASRGGRGGRSGGRTRGRSGGHSGGRYGGRTSNIGDRNNDCPCCQICGRINHIAPQCWYHFDDGYHKEEKPSAALAATPSYSVDANWYSDTSATDHITSDLERLAVREKYQGKDQIQTTGGASMSIRHVGHSLLQTPIRALHLRNILHAPQANKHLLSVHQFTRDNHVFFEFHPYHFLIKDTTTRIPLLRGRCVGGLYPLSFHGAPMTPAALLASRPSADMWHQRLGHPGSFALQKVFSQNNLLCFPSNKSATVCNACQMAKSHQLPFHNSSALSTVPLELVHTDVWGPALHSSSGCRYYVSFIDDFIKFSWIYTIKHKSEVHHVFLEFQTHVERLLNRKILSVQSDWGGEYQRLNTYLKSVGIHHRVSCPHTHQQNGVVERKHRHIVEIGLALLAHNSLPLWFWDEAFITACYLINRLPSKSLRSFTPFERLLARKPSYSHLKVFGCACWPSLRPYNATKLSFQFMQCVFLGYSSMHKGYKCLHVPTGRVYLSRDVIFDEGSFLFAAPGTSPPKPISEHTLLLTLPTPPMNTTDQHVDWTINSTPHVASNYASSGASRLQEQVHADGVAAAVPTETTSQYLQQSVPVSDQLPESAALPSSPDLVPVPDMPQEPDAPSSPGPNALE
jgi:hypothetical protein